MIRDEIRDHRLAMTLAVIVLATAVCPQPAAAADSFRANLGSAIEGESKHRRTDPEAFELRLGGGTYGAYGMISFATLRLEHFYATLARFQGGGGRTDDGGRRAFASMGIGIGVPIHLDGFGHHELRIGLGIGAGTIRQSSKCSTVQGSAFVASRRECVYRTQGFGAVLSPEVVYLWRPGRRFTLRIGVDLQVATSPNTIFEESAADGNEVRYPRPVFNGFVGIGF